MPDTYEDDDVISSMTICRSVCTMTVKKEKRRRRSMVVPNESVFSPRSLPGRFMLLFLMQKGVIIKGYEWLYKERAI